MSCCHYYSIADDGKSESVFSVDVAAISFGPGVLREAGEQVRAGAFERIRAQGAETFARAYSDQAVIRHLATWA